MIGRVTSNKQQKTATVLVQSTKRDRLYHKSYKRSKKYSVDDQLGVKVGDLVEIIKIRPVSKLKHWKIIKVVGRDIEEVVGEQLKEAAAETIEEVMPEEKSEQVTVDSEQLKKTEKPKKESKKKEKK